MFFAKCLARRMLSLQFRVLFCTDCPLGTTDWWSETGTLRSIISQRSPAYGGMKGFRDASRAYGRIIKDPIGAITAYPTFGCPSRSVPSIPLWGPGEIGISGLPFLGSRNSFPISPYWPHKGKAMDRTTSTYSLLQELSGPLIFDSNRALFQVPRVWLSLIISIVDKMYLLYFTKSPKIHSVIA